MLSPEHPTHSISRDSLSRPVRSYDDNLDTQARALFDKYHLTHYDEPSLMKAIEDRTVSLEDARHLRDLLAQRDHIRRTGELPPEAKNNLEYQLKEAKDILGQENVYGPEQVADVFNVDLSLKELPPIPYTHHDLEKAKSLNMKLILRISHDHEGTPLTPKHMDELLWQRHSRQDRGLIFMFNSTFIDEAFYTSETPVPVWHPVDGADTLRAEWKLVTTEVLPNSTHKNYLEQTRLLRETLAEIGWLAPEEAQEVTDDKLKIFWSLSGEEGARILSELKINQRHRRTFSQALYDTLLVYMSQPDPRRYVLERDDDWTVSRSSRGWLVYLGSFSHSGGAVGFPDWQNHGEFGFCLSR